MHQPAGVEIARIVQRHLRRHHAVDGEAARQDLERHGAPRERERRGRQHDRERQLADDESVTEVAVGYADRHAVRQVFQRVDDVDTRRRACRQHAKEQRDDQRKSDREGEHPSIHLKRMQTIHVQEADGRVEDGDGPRRQKRRACGAGDGQDDRFTGEIPRDPPARCAERMAHRQFLSAAGGHGQEQIGDIRAGDEQHERHRPLERNQRRPRVGGERRRQRPQAGGPQVIRYRQAGIRGGELRSRGIDRHVRPQLRVKADGLLAVGRGEHVRSEQLDLAIQDVENREARSEDADDRARRAVDVH